MDIAENLAQVKLSIEEAAQSVDRNAADIDLVAVSKVHGLETIQPALTAGHRRFGENRVQEANEKWPELKKQYADVSLHLIGGLQTNKVKEAVALFDVIETLDRPKLAKVIAKEIEDQNRDITLYIQINTGEEEQKGGCLPTEADDFIRYCIDELKLPIIGLMCIPPADEEPSVHFAFLKKIAKRHGLEKLSMGMSGDYEAAIRHGATSVRVGTAIFGQRPAKD